MIRQGNILSYLLFLPRVLIGRMPLFISVPSVFVALFMLLPMFYLILRSIGTESEIWDLLLRMRSLETLIRTILLSITVTIGSVIIALPLAWLTVRTDLPLRRTWSVILILPLVIPSYVGAFVVVSAFGPTGMIQQAFIDPINMGHIPEISGFLGASLTLIFLSYPYVLLNSRTALYGLDPALEETSRSLGHNRLSTFFRVILPQMRPAIASGSLLVAFYTISDFGAVSIMRYEVFTYIIYMQYDAGARELAAASSLVLVFVAIVLLAVESRARGKAQYFRSTIGTKRPQEAVSLRAWKFAGVLFCASVCIISLVLPLGVLIYWVLRGLGSGQSIGLEATTILNSVYISAFASLVVCILAIPVVILIVRYSGTLSKLLERISYFGYALPGIVIALALVYFTANYVNFLYQTHILLIVGYTLLFFPNCLGTIKSSFLQLSPHIEEAALGLGRKPIYVLTKVTLPLIKTGILSGAALVFLVTMKELPATLILGPIGFKTLATSIWSATEAVYFAQAAAPALLLIVVSAFPMVLLITKTERLETVDKQNSR